ncbi:MAG: ATP-grasp domain-containing protein [Ruminococcaceae bacterium]|nr:ATP-grasp domain-containing protein [Oscillospiraceae bacterium]
MKKLLVVGAGFLQAFVIKKAKEMGYTVVAVDANPNAEGFAYADKYAVINIVDAQACLEYAKAEQIDGVLTAATDYGVLTASYIAQELNLPGLKYSVAKIVKNKYQTRKCLFDNNVDDAEQAYEVSENTDITELQEKLRYPVMVKPCDGSGSRGASRVDNADDLKAACDCAIGASITKRATIEAFVVGKEYGAETLVVDGKPYVLAVMRKWMTEPPYYAELGHAIPSDLTPEVEEKARKCVENAIKALGINFGSVNMDMLITPNGEVYIVDIGARMGGNLIGSHIINAGTGIDYMAAMICNAVGDPVDLTAKAKTAVATRLLAFDGGVVTTMPDMKELERKYGVVIEHHIKLGDTVNAYHTNLDGCGYIVAVENDVELAAVKAENVLSKVRSIVFS